ncbi:hypothetical protein XPA_010594 [Xanthoria parietina]
MSYKLTEPITGRYTLSSRIPVVDRHAHGPRKNKAFSDDEIEIHIPHNLAISIHSHIHSPGIPPIQQLPESPHRGRQHSVSESTQKDRILGPQYQRRRSEHDCAAQDGFVAGGHSDGLVHYSVEATEEHDHRLMLFKLGEVPVEGEDDTWGAGISSTGYGVTGRAFCGVFDLTEIDNW